ANIRTLSRLGKQAITIQDIRGSNFNTSSKEFSSAGSRTADGDLRTDVSERTAESWTHRACRTTLLLCWTYQKVSVRGRASLYARGIGYGCPLSNRIVCGRWRCHGTRSGGLPF